MQITMRLTATAFLVVLAAPPLPHAQGRGGGAWTTSGGDAQRTGWVRADPRISKEAIAKAPLQLLWKRQLEKTAGQLPLSQPVLLPNIISYKGFKALAFLGGANIVYSLDYDLNHMFWQRSLGAAAGSAACGAGPVAVSRSTPLGAPAGGRGAGGFGGGRGGGNNVYAVSSGTGMVHALNPQTGEDATPPAKFTGGSARIAGAVFIDNVVYAAAVETCGSVASGVYAIDLADNANTVTSWDAKGARIAGALGPAFATDGTVFVATGCLEPAMRPSRNAIVALEPRTLKAKDWFTATTPFTSSPVVFSQDGTARGRRVERRRQPLRARRRLARRQRSQDPAREVHCVAAKGGDFVGRSAHDVGRRGQQPLDCGAVARRHHRFPRARR